MKISRKETYLLILLLAIGAVYLLYTFLFKPMMENIDTAKAELAQSSARLADYERTFAQKDLNELELEQQQLINDIEAKTEPLLPGLTHSEILAFFDNVAAASGVMPGAVSIGAEELYDTAPVPADTSVLTYPMSDIAAEFRAYSSEETPAETQKPAGESSAQNTAVVKRLNVDISLSGLTYSQLLGFIKEIESYDRAIYLENITINKNNQETSTGLSVSLNYSFMQTEKLTDNDPGLAAVSAPTDTGKDDPFSGGKLPEPSPEPTEETAPIEPTG